MAQSPALPAILAATLMAAAPAAAQMPAHHSAPVTLSLTAESAISAAPDVADISAGVMTQAPDASAALSANAAAMNRVIAALKSAGIPDRDIQTTGLNVQPQFRFQQNEPPALTGFQAGNRVQARIRDPKITGKVIDAVVKAGANQIDGPTFIIDKPEPMLDKARADAVRIARTRADLYAAAAGLKVKRILSISESGLEAPQPRPMMRMAAVEAADTSSPIAPGQLRVSAQVNIIFELE